MAFTDVLAGVSALSNPYGVPSQGEWNLARGVYTTKVSNKSMVFFYEKKDPVFTQHTAIDQITDSGGRRLAKYEYPYRDGQRMTDLGRRGETFTMNIKFHGLQYQTKLKEFLNVLVNSNEQAIVTHPVRGAVTARYSSHEFVHRYDEWNAVTIKVVFEEDNTDTLAQTNFANASQDSAIRNSLQNLVNAQAQISAAISSVSALLLLPNSIVNAMKNRLNSLTTQISGLIGQLGATFSSNTTIQALAASSQTIAGGITSLSSGTATSTASGSTVTAQLPPVFQVGFDPSTQTAINKNIAAFIAANQITPQQAVYSANAARAGITAAIAEVNTNMSNYGYDIVVQYRGLATSIQQAVESSIAATQSLVTIYTTQRPMSLRQIAFANGLTADDQNTIESLNPYLASVNYIPAGTQVTVPVST